MARVQFGWNFNIKKTERRLEGKRKKKKEKKEEKKKLIPEINRKEKCCLMA